MSNLAEPEAPGERRRRRIRKDRDYAIGAQPGAQDSPGLAAQLNHPNQEYIYSREEAARIISATINAPFSPETLRKDDDVPYVVINGYSRYRGVDLLAKSKRVLDRALRRGRTPRPRQPNGRHEKPAIEQPPQG